MHYNKKIVGIWVIKSFAFLLILLLLFQGGTQLFRRKADTFYMVSPIYDLPKNSVDVLLIGTSHMACTISPMDLWSNYGITSFNAAIPNQTIPTTYFELRELLKVQRPRVVVFETFYIFQQEMLEGSLEEWLHHLIDNIPFSFGVVEAIETLIREDHDKTEYYLNFYSFHNRWKEISEVDFNPSLQGNDYNRGSWTNLYNVRSAIESPSIVAKNETEMPPELSLEYLNKIIELCHNNDIPLVFMAQPCKIDEDRQKMMNYLNFIAEEENIPYINFFYLLDETKFDFTRDMSNNSHVNYFGVQKLTSYLGQYLKTNYNLADHRSDPVIADLWNRDYKIFARKLNNDMMKTAETPDEYFNYLKNQDYIIVWNAYSETPLYETVLPDFFQSMGIELTKIKEENYYYAVTRGGQMLCGGAVDKKPNDSYMTDDTLFSFGPGIIRSSNRIGIHVGREEYSVGNMGLNLVVYDPVSGMVVDSVNIDLDTKIITRE